MNAHADRLGKRLSRLLSEVPPPTADVHPKIHQRLSDARAAFAQGFRQALSVAPTMLPRILQDEPCQRRGFALEGAAMALVLMDEFSAAPQRLLGALLSGRSAGEHTLGAIGVGWASAHLGRSADWLPPELHPRYRHAVADGYGFHQGFFHAHRFAGRGFPADKGELGISYDIGLGRALWFVHSGRAAPIVHSIGRMPSDRRAQLWRGVGTACAFTGNAEYAARTGAAAARFKTHFRAGLETGAQLLRALAQSEEAIL
ncbi:MAG: DUF1702 family protein [Gemmatimonadota bacterium]|nr:DUF1702 family protein [Gemmatimonadota bacterium]